jgi:hypothetical protein
MRDQQGHAAATEKATDPSVKTKKPYTKPSFREERAFETMALTCAKMDPTQGQCGLNVKNS